MNITELDSYNLSDAVKFNNELNPAIWSGTEMKPEVREQLLAIARDFQEFLGLSNLDVKDITVSGSNAGYTYTPHSDIDLHLVVDIPQADADEVYRELFDAKKYQYNDLHDITIGGYDVELYVENANKPPVSKGLFSVLNNEWINIPRKRRADVDDDAVRSKFEDLGHRIESAVAGNNANTITKLAEKIKNMRQAGLAEHGELGPENLAYKILRKQGLIKQLYDARNAARDRELSLKERAPKKPVKYGFTSEDLDTDGVMMTKPTNCSSEAAVPEAKPSDEAILKDFIDFVSKELKLQALPNIKLRKDPQWSVVHKTFGRYIDDNNMLEVAWGQRHIMDVLRTVAHELTHRRQHEREDVPHSAGETGSPYENEANARAGVLMRDYARLHPEYFEADQAEQLHSDEVEESIKGKLGALATVACVAGTPGCASIQQGADAGKTIYRASQLTKGDVKGALKQDFKNILRRQAGQTQNESASGYIPTKKQARDPRFSMALTQDIKPGQVGKEANKLGLKTDSQGHPDLLIKGLTNALREFKETGQLREKYHPPISQVPGSIEDDLGNQEATGPEFPPQMPAGTTKIDVTDLTDWYRLGMDISDMDDADPEDYNQGPPQTVVVFPSDEMEQPYLKQFKRLGLKTHDIDPDVKGGEDIKGKHLKEEQLDEVRMAPSNLRQFADSPEAQGILAGFEAELIFRDTKGDDDGDYEADYDADERAYNIQDVIDFFSNDDYGYGLSDRAADRLRDRLDEAYFEWRDEQMMRDFENEADDLVREVWLEERPMVERIHDALVDGMGLDDADADKVIVAGDKAPRFTKNVDQDEYKQQNELYAQYLEAVDIADTVLDEEVEASVSNQDGYYDTALDNYRDNYDMSDDSGFFDDMGWRWMSSIANEFDLDWPIYTGGSSNYGDRDWDDIGVSLRNATGMQVKVSSGYHSQKRGDYYVIEPDGSLDPDEPSQEVGLEIVSPPMPLNKAIEQLNTVVAWANDPNEGNAYTNRSTGLHMGVSIPYKGGSVDFVKLALFLGDEHVLQSFGRSANTYCKSALKELREKQKSGHNRVKVDDAMTMMKSNLLELAEKYVNAYGVGQAKYTSIHIKPGYIEFRSPGGDYLAKGDEEIDILENTMRRFAYAMYLAGRPDLERKEYYKKLYKLIAPEGGDALNLFAQYATGEITQADLKKQWAEKVISKEVPTTGDEKGTWVLYDNATGMKVPGQQYSGYTEIDAWERAKAKVSPGSSMEGFKKAYTLANDSANTGSWDIVDTTNGNVIDVIEAPNRGKAADEAYDRQYEEDWYVRPHLDLGQPDKEEPKLSRRAQLAKQIAQPKDYVIMNKEDGSTLYTFRASNNTQAVDFGLNYLRDRNMDIGKYSVQRAANAQQAYDNSQDSRQLQQTVQGSNYSDAFERNSDRIDAIRARQPEQVRMPSGVPVWELFDVDTGSVLNVFADHNANEAKRQAMTWLSSIGAESPETYNERFAVRAKMLQPGERNLGESIDSIANRLKQELEENFKGNKYKAKTSSGAKQWTAKIHVKNPQYSGWVDVNTWAPNIAVARQMFKQQYNIQDWHITAVKEIK